MQGVRLVVRRVVRAAAAATSQRAPDDLGDARRRVYGADEGAASRRRTARRALSGGVAEGAGMAVLVDTAVLPPEVRTEATREALASAVSPTRVQVGPSALCRVSAWEFGRGVRLVQVRSSGHRLTRTAEHVRLDAPERVSLGITVAGSGRMAHRDLVPAQRRELLLVDETSPYDFELVGPSTSQAVLVEYGELGIPVDVVRRAVPRLHESPLYALVESHLARLPALADALAPGPARAMLEQATTDLVRALIASAAAGGPSAAGETAAAALHSRTMTFVRQHQRDRDLSAARLAAEQHVSVRTLYAAFAAQGERVSEAVMEGRLEGARRELAVSGPTRTIAAIAHSWGFRDTTHFGRRFRQAFGLSPRAWQAAHAGAASPSDGPGPTTPLQRRR